MLEMCGDMHSVRCLKCLVVLMAIYVWRCKTCSMAVMHKVSVVDMDMVHEMHMLTCLAFFQVLQLGALIRTKQITSVELTSVFQQRLKM